MRSTPFLFRSSPSPQTAEVSPRRFLSSMKPSLDLGLSLSLPPASTKGRRPLFMAVGFSFAFISLSFRPFFITTEQIRSLRRDARSGSDAE